MRADAGPAAGIDRLRRVLDALPDGVLLFTPEWVIEYVNPAGAVLLGRSAEEMVGRPLRLALPDLGDTVFHAFLQHARDAGRPVTWCGYHPPADRWMSATALVDDGLLQVSFRAADRHAGHPSDSGRRLPGRGDNGADRARLRFLAEVSESMIATLDRGESAGRLAQLVAGRLCDWAVVALADDDGGVGQRAWAHGDPARGADLDTYMHGRLLDAGDDAAMVQALLSGRPVRVPSIHHDVVAPSLPTEAVRAAWRRLDAASCTIVPLRARGETFGALGMFNAGDRPPQDDRQLALAVEVARRGALALDNARLYGRQQAVAEKLQRSLLTNPPQPDDLQLAVRYRPASSLLHVGGDWYDAFQSDGALLTVIGDVVGHDLDAAAAMGQVRSILRGVAYDRPDTPASVLARVDTVLTGLHVGTLATALVARVEQSDEQRRRGLRTLRWSSAGHLPPLRMTADGDVDVLTTSPERLLGTGTARRRSDHTTVLDPGDTVLLYTDGLVEEGRTGLDEGIARLAATLAELCCVPLEDLCDRLLDRLVPARADDDVAVLAVRCHPPGARTSAR